MPTPAPEAARAQLVDAFRAKGRVIVAFSGGVDSAVLARVGHSALGDDCLSVIVRSESYADIELEEAVDAAERMGVRYEVVDHSELADPNYAENPVNRCYFCRQGMSQLLTGLARDRGYRAVAMGNNASDLGDHRPGLKAIEEAGLWQPYLELDIDKAGVRALARHMDVPVAEKPSMACLSSRIPYGQPVTFAKLRRIEAAEDFLRRDLGFEQVRVRTMRGGDHARVEVRPDDIPRLRAQWDAVEAKLRECGYDSAEVDARGYRTGALNEGLRVE